MVKTMPCVSCTPPNQMEAEYITAEDWRQELGLSPTQFFGYLKEHHLPISVCLSDGLLFLHNRFSADQLDDFYSDYDLEEAINMLSSHTIIIHRNDIAEHKRKISTTTKHLPASTGSRKDTARIETTRQACELVREEIKQEKHGFYVNGVYKTNKDHFKRVIQNILGDVKAHRDTVREEWKKVPDSLKHVGRPTEQMTEKSPRA